MKERSIGAVGNRPTIEVEPTISVSNEASARVSVSTETPIENLTSRPCSERLAALRTWVPQPISIFKCRESGQRYGLKVRETKNSNPLHLASFLADRAFA
jgi:hypothetical protein